MNDLEQRIRERAYRIWEEEGAPDGRAKEHWDMAQELVAQEENLSSATEPNPLAKDDAPPGGEPVEPPEALANQGEFPTLTDQGEASSPPSRARRRKASTSPANRS